MIKRRIKIAIFGGLSLLAYALCSCSLIGDIEQLRPQTQTPIADAPLELTGTVSISGTAQVGQTLTADISGLVGNGEVSYQWKRGGTNVGSNNNTYVPAASDVGSTITVTVTRAGYTGSVTSAPTATVTAAPSQNFIYSAGIIIIGPENGQAPNTATGISDGSGFTASAVSWSPAHSPFLGSTVYAAAVGLTAAEGYAFAQDFGATINGNNATISNNTGATVTLSYAFAPTLAKEISEITIQSPPANLNYTHGDTLDLSGLIARIKYTDTTFDDIPLANFAGIGISASPHNGQQLVHVTHNSQSVAVTLGVHSASTGNLAVSKSSLAIANVEPLSKIYDGNTSATPGAVTFSGLAAGDSLVLNTDYTVSAQFVNAAIGTGKQYSYTVTMLYTPAIYNYNFSPNPNTVTRNDGIIDPLIEMAWLNAGSYTRGSNDSQDNAASPAHQVTLTSGFYMGRYEVTQGQYLEVMGHQPSNFAAGETTGRRPVEMVTWFDAVEFCNKLSELEGLSPVYSFALGSREPATGYPITGATVTANWGANGYRLPTEAEWEYACRAGTTTAYNTGNSITTSQANFNNILGRTTSVGSYAPNAWGLYDMHGNVLEWCWDWLGSYSGGAQADPRGPGTSSQRVIRDGSWGNGAQGLRSAWRGNGSPGSRSSYIGFRVVRN